jgi:D-alanyl-D-alanine carboxypeptidase
MGWKNTNKYLTGDTPTPEGVTVIGGKTGTTNPAGHCLIILVVDGEGHRYVSIVMGTPDTPSLYGNMTGLISGINKIN